MTQKENKLSRRKNSALRVQEEMQYVPRKQKMKTFYTNTKTIDFNSGKTKENKPPIKLIPKSLNQEKFILALMDNQTDIVIVSGPAGTGKTYLAMLAAIRALRNKEVDRIVLTRPAVGVDDEKHGFLPGDLNQKMEPWTRPLFDVLREYYSMKEIHQMLEEQIIEISPLAFMRGRTFKNSYIIADEMQNATPSQMKMIMTRIGEGSKLIIGGDIEQTDRKTNDNGLLDLQNKLSKQEVEGLRSCEFHVGDVQRHRMVEHVLKLYR